MEKSLLAAVSWVGKSLKGSPGWGKQYLPVWWIFIYDTCLLALWLCGVQKQDNGFCLLFCLGESCLLATALMVDTSVPPCMSLCLSSCYPDAGTQREWVWVIPCMGGVSLSNTMYGFFKRNFLGLQKFLLLTQSHWFLKPEVMGISLPGTGTLGGGAWHGAGIPCPLTSWIFIHHTWMWDQPILHLQPSYQSRWMWFL